MGDLAVSVSLEGTPVADAVLPVRHIVRIGEAANSAVAFPGADIAVVRIGRDLAVRGRRLAEGQGIGVSLGPVRVWMEHTKRARFRRPWREHLDLRFLAVALLVTVAGLWFESFEAAFEARSEHGFVARQIGHSPLRALLPARAGPLDHGSPDRRTAGLSATGDQPAQEPVGGLLREGPEAVNDDHRSGVGFYAWYRSAVLDDVAPSVLARERIARDPTDERAHDILARSAYEADRFELAAAHFRWLDERGDRGLANVERELLWRLARTERRLGRHAAEARSYERILALQPDEPWALGGQATVMARLGRFDEAASLLNQASSIAPGHAYLDVYAAVVAAEQGLDSRAVELLEGVLAQRDGLAPEYQVELRRDIALDPAFSGLRSAGELRVMLARQLGAAAPRQRR
jgi:tetratricopeptide (TPR) repeat protein